MCLARFEPHSGAKRDTASNRWTRNHWLCRCGRELTRFAHPGSERDDESDRDRGMLAANAAPRDVPWQPPERRVSGSVDAELKLVPARTPCEPNVSAVPASVRRPRQSSTRGIDWPETRATGASNFHAVVQFLNAIFQVAALAVDLLVEPSGTLFHVGDNKARIILRIAVGMPSDFRLIKDATLVLPGLLRL